MSLAIAVIGGRVGLPFAGAAVLVIETFGEIEPQEEAKAVTQDAVEAGMRNVAPAVATRAGLRDGGAPHRAGTAELKTEPVAGIWAVTLDDEAVFIEAAGAEEAPLHDGGVAPEEPTRGLGAAVVVTRGDVPVLDMRAVGAGVFVAGAAALPDSEPTKPQRQVVLPDQRITGVRN